MKTGKKKYTKKKASKKKVSKKKASKKKASKKKVSKKKVSKKKVSKKKVSKKKVSKKKASKKKVSKKKVLKKKASKKTKRKLSDYTVKVTDLSLSNVKPSSFSTYYNYWADFLEMYCLFIDGRIASIDDLDDINIDSHVGNEFDVNGIDESITNNGKIEDVYNFVESRKALFGASYPFQIEPKTRKITLKKNLDNSHKLYLSLLISSNPSFFKKKYHKWTKEFESFSRNILKIFMPKNSIVANFGASGIVSNIFKSNKVKQRFIELSKHIKIPTTVEFDKIPDNRSGDLEIDLVSWKKFAPRNNGRGTVVAFAQCSCGKDWVKKQKSIAQDTLRKYLAIKDNILSFIFVPQALRAVDGSWEKPYEIESVIVIDRLTILRSFKKAELEKMYKAHFKNLLEPLLKISFNHFDI